MKNVLILLAVIVGGGIGLLGPSKLVNYFFPKDPAFSVLEKYRMSGDRKFENSDDPNQLLSEIVNIFKPVRDTLTKEITRTKAYPNGLDVTATLGATSTTSFRVEYGYEKTGYKWRGLSAFVHTNGGQLLISRGFTDQEGYDIIKCWSNNEGKIGELVHDHENIHDAQPDYALALARLGLEVLQSGKDK